jgi:hypothetical protein
VIKFGEGRLESLLPQLGAVRVSIVVHKSSTRSAASEASWIHSSHSSHGIVERLRLWFLPTVLNMAHDGSDKAFVSSARLYAIVPETSNSRFSDFLSNANQDDEADSALPLPIKERKVLFFGELALQC